VAYINDFDKTPDDKHADMLKELNKKRYSFIELLNVRYRKCLF
jgi:hypothetical protein